ncbi:MAG: hypothetical protein A3J93_02025 [Candidatus Magasanikbacteria bacterium RIFOXYC2_FULL_42_28]|uniref:Uncharacterized protein n=1 Tax=Candidatus Magasanikbacteria bacterium RIFOXYC2_FULL_42_28 TaxID=1798704 RepID=A0A1F6NWH4_9BACT|nr:MAG: hypothetical protein A3J93_02025 [Candidatus Magasanikbacteria bacterium RIFOXYC2_FULL_42_28]
MPVQTTNPIEEYVLEALKANGFEKMNDEAQATYFPQFVAHAEQRLGAALLPFMNEKSANEFAKLMKNSKIDPKVWWQFWEKNVPNFVEVVKKTLADFAVEVKQAFGE